MESAQISLSVLNETLSVCKLPARDQIPAWVNESSFSSITRTSDELSIVCEEKSLPDGVKAEQGWSALKVDGQLDFGLTGILASIAQPLAEAEISIFAISTYDTDYVLIKSDNLADAITVLRKAGHNVKE